MKPEDLLQSLNLSAEQTDIYLSLLRHGPQSAGRLAKSTNVKRTYVYTVCQELAKLGLLKTSLVGEASPRAGKTSTFTPSSPDALLTLSEQIQLSAKAAKTSLENILPDLLSLYRLTESRPVVNYHEGPEGIKKTYLDTIKVGQPLLSIVETSKVDQKVYDWVTTDYVRARIKANIPVRAIVASGEKTKIYTSLDEKELRESRIVPSQNFPFENEIIVYGEKVAIVKHKAGTKLIGIIIDNAEIAATFRSWFELTWSTLKPVAGRLAPQNQ